jgi:alpha-amylase/alpha-mannosidase (GH57 family)
VARLGLWLTVLVWVASCAGKPAPYRPSHDVQQGDSGYLLPDGRWVPDPDVTVTDSVGESRVTDPDALIPDGTILPDIPPEEDKTPPKVVGAFSPEGQRVTVRFSEPIDASTGGTKGNYSITGSDMSQVGIASVEVYKQFAHLTLSNPGQVNSAFTYTVLVQRVEDLAGNVIGSQHNRAVIKRPVYLSIVWHQHQPSYVDPVTDQLKSPWVRLHATKDYYDMASVLEPYPDVHVTMNMTPVLMVQLLEYYVDRMAPYVDTANNVVDEAGFFANIHHKTDPWIDLLLEDTPTPQTATEKQLGLLYKDPWACVSTSPQIMKHFPQYVELREKNPALLTQEDFRKLKILFAVAWMDPDFLQGPVEFPDGSVIDLTDVISRGVGLGEGGRPMDVYTVTEFTEELANRMVAEHYKIMANIVGIHSRLMYDPDARTGQIEITTTPFYHPILPLIYHSDLARPGQPYDNLPHPPFSNPGDASAHVLRAVRYHTDLWGIPPKGMWCGEGSVAEEIVEILVDAGLLWTATDQRVMERSHIVGGHGSNQFIPYKIDSDKVEGTGGSIDDEMVILFRDTHMSDRIGFQFQMLDGPTATNEFMTSVLAQAPNFGAADRLVSIILDGENAWESYKLEHDGKGFFHALYGALSESFALGEVITVTPSEYILGNPDRGIPPHPVTQQREIEPLFPGSWIAGTFAVWIGETEENQGWDYLVTARNDLTLSGLPRPNPSAPAPPQSDTLNWLIWKAYDEMYASEGSDWFWWYGDDMTSPSNDDSPFDQAFRVHLHAMYSFMNQALVMQGKTPIQEPDFAPIVQVEPKSPEGPFTVVPVMDGVFVPNEAEWHTDGGFFFDNDSGTMANPSDHISVVYFGYHGQDFYLALQFNPVLSEKLGTNYNVNVYTNHKHITNPDLGLFQSNPINTHTPHGVPLLFDAGGAAWEIRVDFSGATAKVVLGKADGAGNWTSTPHQIVLGGPTTGGKVLELKIPLASLQMAMGDPLEIMIVAAAGNTAIDTAPYSGTRVIFADVTTLVYVTFEVDVSGTLLPVNSYTWLENPPPPQGNGIVYITGNQDALANWVPNKVPLVDNGQAPDVAASDRKWTATWGFAPGTLLRYKYTIGLPKDEGAQGWSKTEEFPLTERGITVTQDPQYKKMILRDVFADRPQPSGTMGPNTQVEYLP